MPYNINTDLSPGDCLISFEVSKIHLLRQHINKLTGGSNCAMIYGRMPANIKLSQADEFNKGKLKYLVATDAIGMGLNLNIKRIVFTNIFKQGISRYPTRILPH